MKLTRKDTFKPITIVIESQDELDQLYGVCRSEKFCKNFPLFEDIYNNIMNEENDIQIITNKVYFDKFLDMLK